MLGRLAGEQRGVAVVVVQQVKCIWNKFRAEFVKVKEGKKAQSGISYNISLYIVVCSEFWLVYFFFKFWNFAVFESKWWQYKRNYECE